MLRVGEVDAKPTAIPQQSLELIGIVGCRNDQNIPDASQHKRG
ncbi:hypothetical protein ARTSIC4J27_939 [Pseudarthrobacter siccitolerans]|uniref:Uncharacterized protein n=1 Tax=Pseudarthrobacter siccitolerans TaxID=861266 RepID=A0A024GZI6_9MICC|nr:hypothetical protein ARTSIC4J27_939 [Pseudarthrobacter siccitolerans]